VHPQSGVRWMNNAFLPDYLRRIDKLRKSLADHELDALLVFSQANRRYLTGFTARDVAIGESSGYVLITQEKALLLVNSLYIEHAQKEVTAVEPFLVKDKPNIVISDLLRDLGLHKVGFERDYVTYGFIDDLRSHLEDQVELLPVKGLVEAQRVIKDPYEQNMISEAAKIADAAFSKMLDHISPGMTEKQVARLLDNLMIELGAEDPSFETIVAAGPNAARPHHEPTDKPVQEGEPIIVDMGAFYRGYCSDMTRTFCLGKPDSKFEEVYNIVLEAHNTARSAIRAGLDGGEIDAIARGIIDQAGYGEAFTHSLGHGVGLEVHEKPSLRKNSEDVLQEGMVVTVEPGIYISGWGGVRIESLVLVDNGPSVLSQAPIFKNR